MKTTIKILSAFILTLCFFSATAQYKSAAGLRFEDDWFLGTYKLNINNRLSVEAFGGLDTQKFITLTKFGAEFHLNTEIPDLENLRWYYGAGAGLLFGDVSGINAFGSGGLDYYFDDVPLNLSLQLMPGIYFGDYSGDFEIDFSLSARYILGN